ncbi:MAG: acireductone synthase [Gammaproteobacteria bacterium]|nr:acireductone synthase [Gammaproteobacteria bacterium]MDH5731229.1 acireductone synthase [Gammaproteobacteria bacterium]
MIKAIVTDIEGTTSSISFVHEVLFPYADANIQAFVQQHASRDDVIDILKQVESEVGSSLSVDEAIQTLRDWIKADKKITSLKSLQGLIWESGYTNGDFQGHIYDDAYQRMMQWHEQGIPMYVYSSGSVKAQKLLFAHTPFGDLTPLFAGYFDTTIGAKVEPQSYLAIAKAIDLPPEEVLFLSDIKKELDAAKTVHMQTYWLVREGELNVLAEHTQVSDFHSIHLS